jgi:hypothetical protein
VGGLRRGRRVVPYWVSNAATATEGAPAHDLTVWLRGIDEPFRLALPEAEVRRVLARWGEQARSGEAELRVGDQRRTAAPPR